MSFLEDTPRCLHDLRAIPVPAPNSGELPAVIAFESKCRVCGAGAFGLLEESHGGSPAGIIIRCRQCGTEDQVFDGLTNGYDGELGNTEHLSGPRSVEEFVRADGSATVEGLFAVFTFNVEADELEEIAEEEGKRAVDLFDWFSLSTRAGRPDPTPWDYYSVWDYECA